MTELKKSYPMLPVAHWWTLRRKFIQSIPGVVTDNYLATVLGMAERSAQGNVLPYLKKLGIIDEDGKTGEMAKKWRDDQHYPEVCKEMLIEVYPQELLDAVTDPKHRAQAERWFANDTGTGEVAARRMAALYMVLLEADPSKQAEQEKGEHTKKAVSGHAEKKAEKKINMKTAPNSTAPAPAHVDHKAAHATSQMPCININLEIHISADSTPEQIDQIFLSMAKHIYKAG